jgi:hypothetical protein
MKLGRSNQRHKDGRNRLLEMALLGIPFGLPPSAWTTLRVAHIPTASTSAKTFFSRNGEDSSYLFDFERFFMVIYTRFEART